MKKRIPTVFLIFFLFGCLAREDGPSSAPTTEVTAGPKTICSIDFPYEPICVRWINNETVFLMGRNKRAPGEPDPAIDQLFFFHYENQDLIRLDLSQIEGFDYTAYWTDDSGYNSNALFLEYSNYQDGRPFSEESMIKIPASDPSAMQVAHYRFYFEEYRKAVSQQGWYLLAPKPVVSDRFMLIDAFTGEEKEVQTELLYQMEAARISPNLQYIYLPHPDEDSQMVNYFDEQGNRIKGGAEEGSLDIFSAQTGELLYSHAAGQETGIPCWSQSGNYLLYVDWDVQTYDLSVQVYWAKNGEFLWKRSLEQATWDPSYLAGDFFYCLSTGGRTLYLLNLSTGVMSTTDLTTMAKQIGVSPDGSKAAMARGDMISVISLADS